jgi:hypothetical protein
MQPFPFLLLYVASHYFTSHAPSLSFYTFHFHAPSAPICILHISTSTEIPLHPLYNSLYPFLLIMI